MKTTTLAEHLIDIGACFEAQEWAEGKTAISTAEVAATYAGKNVSVCNIIRENLQIPWREPNENV